MALVVTVGTRQGGPSLTMGKYFYIPEIWMKNRSGGSIFDMIFSGKKRSFFFMGVLEIWRNMG